MVRNRSTVVRSIVALGVGVSVALLARVAVSAYGRVFDTDFYVFYESAVSWRAGADLYETTEAFPNLNPPHFVVAFVPFTIIGPHAALMVWQFVNIMAGAAVVALIWRELTLPRTFTAIGTAVAAAGLTTGVQFGLEEAQPTGVFALLFTCAWLAARRSDERRAGVLLGLLVSVKPFFGCVLLVPLLRGRWRTIAWSVAGVAIPLAAGAVLSGVDSYVRWLEVGRTVTWFAEPLNASIMGIAARAGLTWRVWLAAAVLVLIATAAAIRQSDHQDTGWLAAGLASILISPLGWLYYLPLLAGPLTAVARHRPAILSPGLAFVWPIPLVIATAQVTAWTAVTIFSMPAWGLLGVWAGAIFLPERGEPLRVQRPPRAVRIALNSRRNVACDCPRCCTRKPSSTARPAPARASTTADRPAMIGSPSSHPLNNRSFDP
jgi:hypothetical protein